MGAVPNYLSVLLGMWERKGLEEEVHSITTLQSFAPNPQIGAPVIYDGPLQIQLVALETCDQGDPCEIQFTALIKNLKIEFHKF